MPKVEKKHPREKFESLLRRFKQAVNNDGLMNDYRKHEAYEKPSIKRKRARAAAVKRQQREVEKNQALFKRPY